MTRKAARKKEVPFDEALRQLEEIVQRLEAGDITLEESIRLFEQGVQLSKLCGGKLQDAERKIEMLVQDGPEGLRSVPFPESDREAEE